MACFFFEGSRSRRDSDAVPLPESVASLVDMIVGAVDLSAEGVKIANAWKLAKQQGLEGVPQMEELFDKLGMDVRNVFSQARIDEQVLEAVRKTRPIVQGQAQISGLQAQPAAQIQEEQAADVARDEEIEAFEERHTVEAQPEQVSSANASVVQQMTAQIQSSAPASMKGVFVDDAAVLNKAGGYWMGCIPVKQLVDSQDVEQVKAGAKGKHGVINPISGDYQQDTEAIYVWKRKNGRLEVISGRHKYDLALRTNTEAVTCYVYPEDAQHDANWSRLIDFENNMRGDQADELTAAIYTRETGYSDQQLRNRGLMRNKSKSKRGILIGREAREELWTRFKNDVISPMDAEIIVKMTMNIRNAERIEDIQAKCVDLLEQKKSWDYISAMVQLMASKESVFMQQGLLDLGADFEADMQKAATYIEKNVQGLAEAIGIIKSGRKLSGKKKELASRLGQHTTTQEESTQILEDLTLMKEMFGSVGAYPELVASAQMWDGETKLDPVGYALDYARKTRERVEGEKELSREEWEQAQVDLSGMGEFSFSAANAGSLKFKASLLAPNGKPSNLNERQWHQVRTPEFKKWFGDWENDPENASKAIDENGEPKVYYHGTWEDFSAFAYEKQSNMMYGEGFYFTGDASHARAYGDIIMPVFLNARYSASERMSDRRAKKPLKELDHIRVKDMDYIAVQAPTQIKSATNNRGTFDASNPDITFSAANVGSPKIKASLLAPNGKPSNLNEKQWYQVRTPEFKKWFGDWENDPENASKAVDENGEPLVVYHGAITQFFEFMHGKGKKGYDMLGEGFYFTDAKDEAERYAEARSERYGIGNASLMSVFLNLRSPLVFDKGKPSNNKKIILQSDSHDGIIHSMPISQSVHYVVLSPNKIKSATDNRGTFDEGNPDITFSIREFSPSTYKEKDLASVADVYGVNTPSVAQVNTMWGGVLNYLVSDDVKNARQFYPVSPTPAVLQMLGVEPRMMGITKATIDKVTGGKHAISTDQLRTLPAQLSNPVAVFESAQYPNSYMVLTTIVDVTANGEKPAMAAIYLDKSSREYGVSIHEIASIYGRTSNSAYEKAPLLYVNRSLLEAGSRGGLQLPTTAFNPKEGSTDTIKTEADLVKYKEENNISFSVRSMQESAVAARAMFAERVDEMESVQILKRYDMLIDTLQSSLASDSSDEALGTGAQRYASLLALLEATKGVLPEQYTRMGQLNATLKWAAVYAQMAESGDIPRGGSGVLKGDIAQKFLTAMKQKRDGMLLQGLSEEEAREAMASLAAERIENSLIKVAIAARTRVDKFIKDRAWERVELSTERAYPKKETGRKSPRGKLSSEGYRQMEHVLSLMQMKKEQIAEQMASLRGQLAELNPDTDNFSARQAELEEQLDQLSVFGNWADMNAPQAQAAAEAFVALVMQRKTLWQYELEKRTLHRHYRMNLIKSRFKVANNANNRAKQKRSTLNAFNLIKSVAREKSYGLMSYTQLIYAGKNILGDAFSRERIQEIADANQSLNMADSANDTFFAQAVAESTGIDLSKQGALIDWLNDFGAIRKTGIKKQEFVTYTLKLTIDDARTWAALSPEERAARRDTLAKNAEEEELVTKNIPNERDITEITQQLSDIDQKTARGKNMSGRKWIEVRGRYKGADAVELIASKDSVANALLLFEQEDYQHLIEHEGFTPLDASGKVIDRDIHGRY